MAKTTLYRKTSVVFDDHLPSLIQPWFALLRKADDLARSGHSAKTNVVRLPGAGWILKPYVFDPGKVHETTTGSGGILSVGSGLLTVASTVVEYDSFKQSGLSGVTYSGAPAAGSPVWQKRIGSGASFADSLAADQSAYPSPDASSDTVALDRIVLANENMEPDDWVLFRFFVPGSPVQAATALATLYFCGPAGSDSYCDGNGQYALKLFGDGLAYLYERKAGVLSSTMWVVRKTLRWAHPQLVYGSMHQIAVGSDAAYLEGFGRSGYAGRRLFIRTTAVPYGMADTPNRLISTVIAAAIVAIDVDSGAFDTVYTKPGPIDHPCELAPVRVDARRDVRIIGQLTKGQYPTTGEFQDDPFTLDFPPTTDENFTLEWYATTPSGCTVDVKLFDGDTDVELSDETTTISDAKGGQKTYTLNEGQRKYYAKVFFTSGGSKTPLLTELRVFRDPVVETPSIATTTIYMASGTDATRQMRQIEGFDWSITGPGPDPSHETASFKVHDYCGLAEFLKVRAGMPVRIETTYDAGGSNKSVLFRGYVSEARATKVHKGAQGAVTYPDPWGMEYEVTALGEYRRMQEQLAPKRFNWYDKEADAPYKITQIIETLLLAMGYPASMIDVPDLPLRLFSSSDDEWILEPGSTMDEAAVAFARDYLGAFLIFDNNCGSYGKWRLLQQKTAPYNVLARFTTQVPANGVIVNADGAYGSTSETSPLGNSQTVQTTFVRKGTYESWVVPPEGNQVTVYGYAAGENGAAEGQPEGGIISQTLINVDSYNFFNLDPAHDNYPDTTSPDYLGRLVPIRVYDPSLQGCDAVNWVCKRVYQAACFAQTWVSFEAPLILVTDADDAEQTKPRPLRFYDAVEVWNPRTAAYETYIVGSCNPVWKNDKHQMARYEMFTTTNIAEFMAV